MTPLIVFVLRRLLQIVPLVFAVVTLNFILIHAAPGDPIHILVGEVVSEEFILAVRARLGLDKPLYEQFIIYVWNIMKGDLSYSLLKGQAVSSLIIERIPATLILIVAAMLVAIPIGIIAGVISATRRGFISLPLSLVSVIGVSIPTFWLGQILLLIFSINLGLFPIGGMHDIRAGYQGLAYLLNVLHHLTLPAITLGTFHLAFVTRLSRTSMLEALTQDFIVTARSKGLSERVVIFKHALRNALLPVTTYTGLTIGVLFAGAILTETVFSWPGMGSLLYDSLRLRDYPVVLGILLYTSIIVALANLIVDILYSVLDPRIRIR